MCRGCCFAGRAASADTRRPGAHLRRAILHTRWGAAYWPVSGITLRLGAGAAVAAWLPATG
jgi:hypothetical protein